MAALVALQTLLGDVSPPPRQRARGAAAGGPREGPAKSAGFAPPVELPAARRGPEGWRPVDRAEEQYLDRGRQLLDKSRQAVPRWHAEGSRYALPPPPLDRSPSRSSSASAGAARQPGHCEVAAPAAQPVLGAAAPVAQPLHGSGHAGGPVAVQQEAPRVRPRPAAAPPKGRSRSPVLAPRCAAGSPRGAGAARAARAPLQRQVLRSLDAESQARSEEEEEIIDHVASLYVHQADHVGNGALAEKLKTVMAGGRSDTFLHLARMQSELKSNIDSISQRIRDLEEIDGAEDDTTRVSPWIEGDTGAISPSSKGADPLKTTEVTLQMRNIRRILHSLHWPNLQNELRRWVKKGGETEQSMREFLKSIKEMDRDIKALIEGRDRGEEFLIKRRFAITAQMKHFHTRMTSVANRMAKMRGIESDTLRTKRAQMGKILTRQFIDQKSHMRQLERARKRHDDGAAQQDRAEESPEDDADFSETTSPAASPRSRKLGTRLLMPTDIWEDAAVTYHESEAGQDARQSTMQKAEDKEEDEVSEYEEGAAFDINAFDDQRYGHLKRIYSRHDEKIKQLKGTIEQDTEELAKLQEEITRKLEDEAVSSKALGGGAAQNAAATKQRMANLVTSLGPDAQKKFMLLRERDALAKFLNESTCEDRDAQMRVAEVKDMRRGRDGLILESELADLEAEQQEPDAAFGPSAALEEAMGTASRKPSKSPAPSKTITKEEAFQARAEAAETSQVEALERDLIHLREEIVDRTQVASKLCEEVNKEAAEEGLGDEVWALRSEPALQAFYLVSPMKPVIRALMFNAEKIMGTLSAKGPGAAARRELATAFEHAQETFQAEEDARRGWHEEGVEFKGSRWKTALDKAIATLTLKLDAAFARAQEEQSRTLRSREKGDRTGSNTSGTASRGIEEAPQAASGDSSRPPSSGGQDDPEDDLLLRIKQGQHILDLHSKVVEVQQEIDAVKRQILKYEPDLQSSRAPSQCDGEGERAPAAPAASDSSSPREAAAEARGAAAAPEPESDGDGAGDVRARREAFRRRAARRCGGAKLDAL
ncbi:unnamed protein product [Prorocentrum cordatum]|uniref:Uncharacterized protein n=1 Tax=Prorocentrum cordatum TaxID=2364126 RepID=A0ABN9SVZ0_9DINO|nr:unnamed protein product [Polarella glacialis]